MVFDRVSTRVTRAAGSPWASLFAFLAVLIWSCGGFFFGFGNTYQLIINTGTTIVTFLMVFLIQASQNKNDLAMQLKLDELINAIETASNEVIDLEDAPRQEIEQIKRRYTYSGEPNRYSDT
jgi:low affinity Fe/Cu permease